MHRTGVIIALVFAAGCGPEPQVKEVLAKFATTRVTYKQHVKPILSEYCVECHTSEGVKIGGYELDTFTAAHAGRIHFACVSITRALIDAMDEAASRTSTTSLFLPPHVYATGTMNAAGPCNDPDAGGWTPLSMPKGASRSGLTMEEQVLFAKWATGEALEE